MTILTVSQLNRYVKSVLDGDKNLSDLYVKGEISNFTRHFKSGHCYFSLKDAGGVIRAVMFKTYADSLRFEPENGMSVLLRAGLSAYERDGAYQLYVTDVSPDGAGAAAVAFEQLKRRLSELGMFDESHKKPLPKYPRRIGVVTSETGAALQDIINVISRRYPACTVVTAYAQVQGDKAAASLISALKMLDERGKTDVIIIGRGGGAAEDLAAFNDEALAHAVYEAKTPVVSAVGHETDYTVCDFVADVRAPTPSAAAELATPPIEALYERIRGCGDKLRKNARQLLETSATRLDRLKNNPALANPYTYISKQQQRLDFLSQSLYNSKRKNLNGFETVLSARAALLDSLSPTRVMARGYCMAFRGDDAVLSVSGLKTGDRITVKFRDGEAKTSVLEVNNEK